MKPIRQTLTAIALSSTLFATPFLMTGCGRSEQASDITTPDYALENYRWFKAKDAAISQVNAQIGSMQEEVTAYKSNFADVPMTNWPFDARETYSQKETILRGYISQRNLLTAEFNAHASDFTRNWTRGAVPENVRPFLDKYQISESAKK